MRFRTAAQVIEQAPTLTDALALTPGLSHVKDWSSDAMCAVASRPDVTEDVVTAIVAATDNTDRAQYALVRNPVAVQFAMQVLNSSKAHRLLRDEAPGAYDRIILAKAITTPGNSRWDEALAVMQDRLGNDAYRALVREFAVDGPDWQARVATSALMSLAFTDEVLDWVQAHPGYASEGVMEALLTREVYGVEHVERIYDWLTAPTTVTMWGWEHATAGNSANGMPSPQRLALLRLIVDRSEVRGVVAAAYTAANGDPQVVHTVLRKGYWMIAKDVANLGDTAVPVEVATAALRTIEAEAEAEAGSDGDGASLAAINLLLASESPTVLDLTLRILSRLTQQDITHLVEAIPFHFTSALLKNPRSAAAARAAAALNHMAGHDEPAIRAAVVQHLLPHDARTAMDDPSRLVRLAYAKHPHAHPDDLITLLGEDEEIAMAVVKNPAATSAVVTAAANCGHESVQHEATVLLVHALA